MNFDIALNTATVTAAIETRTLTAFMGTHPKDRQHQAVLNGIDLVLKQGSWTCIVGPNGAGKSTLLKCIAGLLPYQGEVLWQGKNLTAWSLRQRAQHLSWLGQNEAYMNDLSVWDVVMLGRIPYQTWLATANAADIEAVERALLMTQTQTLRQRSLGQLSGGERQRVLLARAFAVEAQVFLMDEPLSNLDPPHQAQWIRCVRKLVAEGKTVISVLHEISTVFQADELLILSKGQVVHHGSSKAPKTHDALIHVFEQCLEIREFHGCLTALLKAHGP